MVINCFKMVNFNETVNCIETVICNELVMGSIDYIIYNSYETDILILI
jgi:hypothetical protein